MFGRRFETIFPEILYFREGISPPKHYHLPYGNPTFLWEGNVCYYKKTKIPLSSPKATRRRSPPTTAVTAGRRWQPSTTASGGRRPPSIATGRSPATTSLKGIFGNLSTIPRNSICIPNTPKISYPRKLFPEIVFLEILFPRIKIHSVYQTPP